MDTVTQDAQNRAARTFWQGLAIDLILALSGTLLLSFADSPLVWTAAYWAGLGTLLLKTILTAAASFLVRYWRPPS